MEDIGFGFATREFHTPVARKRPLAFDLEDWAEEPLAKRPKLETNTGAGGGFGAAPAVELPFMLGPTVWEDMHRDDMATPGSLVPDFDSRVNTPFDGPISRAMSAFEPEMDYRTHGKFELNRGLLRGARTALVTPVDSARASPNMHDHHHHKKTHRKQMYEDIGKLRKVVPGCDNLNMKWYKVLKSTARYIGETEGAMEEEKVKVMKLSQDNELLESAMHHIRCSLDKYRALIPEHLAEGTELYQSLLSVRVPAIGGAAHGLVREPFHSCPELAVWCATEYINDNPGAGLGTVSQFLERANALKPETDLWVLLRGSDPWAPCDPDTQVPEFIRNVYRMSANLGTVAA